MNSKNKKELEGFLRFAKKYPVAAIIIVVIIAAVIIIQSVKDGGADSPETSPVSDGGVTVHYIDVGQGDAELVECGGEYLLIDGGDVDAGKGLREYLKDAGVTHIDYMVCTHGHADHCGGLDEVLKSCEVDEIFTSPYPGNKKAYEIFLEAAEEYNVPVDVSDMGVTYNLGDAKFKFIGPVEEHDDLNANSLVLRLEYGKTSFLFTGDMTSKAEKELINDGQNVKCDVLKVGHHGSSGSSCYQFLYEAEPKTAVICCGKDNSYGHPHEEALSRLSDCGAEILRTDTMGSIVLHSDGTEVRNASQ